MIISPSDSELWKIVLTIVEVGVGAWAIVRARRGYDNREDIVADGWVTRWSDDPAAYQAEHRQSERQHYEAIAIIVVLLAFQVILRVYG